MDTIIPPKKPRRYSYGTVVRAALLATLLYGVYHAGRASVEAHRGATISEWRASALTKLVRGEISCRYDATERCLACVMLEHDGITSFPTHC